MYVKREKDVVSIAASLATTKSKSRYRRKQQSAKQNAANANAAGGASSPSDTVDERRGDADAKNAPAKSVSSTIPASLRERDGVPSLAESVSLASGGEKAQKRVIYRSFSEKPKDVLEMVIEDTPLPLTETDVVIKVSASTVSYGDCMIRRGICFQMVNPTVLPTTPGSDVVGNIVRVGPKAGTKFKVGDRVAALVRTGGNARYISVPEDDLVEVPRSCDAAEAASMVTTYMTAYQALRLVTKDNFTLSGKRVLVTGGIEPVGQALIQLCIRAGASEIFATAPLHRHKYIKSVLHASPLPVDPQEWLPIIKGGMDIVFDGTCNDSLESPYASLKTDGTLVCVGMSALLRREPPGFFGAPLAAYWARFKGTFLTNTKTYEVWESFNENKDGFKMDMEILFHLLKRRFIKPHIAKRIGLSDVAEAHATLEQENARGEIVCLPWKRTAASN